VVNGIVDDSLRALVRLPISASGAAGYHVLDVWIDTAFNGTLVLPRKHVAALGLVKESSAEAILADGRSVELETFACSLEWFGKRYETQVVANDGTYPLLGTSLLEGRRLTINYHAHTVELT
jgi:clan AA aspartic protease